MVWIGWLYQDEKGRMLVAKQEQPTELVPLREVGEPRCAQHGCIKQLCTSQYHAPNRDA